MTDWSARILNGDCFDVMASLESESVDAVVSDPPYGIEFMGKGWDKFIPHDRVEMSPRWANPHSSAASHASDLRDHPNSSPTGPTVRRCGTRHACRTPDTGTTYGDPHKCDDEGKADWRVVPSYAGASPDVLAFEEFSKAWAKEAYRVLKPGGHLLAFGATRMYHRLACGIEDAGFEIRDSLHWIYGSGFPKSLDVSKAIDKKMGAERTDREVGEQASNKVLENPTRSVVNGGTPVSEEAQTWDGWGTALKPAHEPIIMARKPLSGTVAETVLAHGTGALNIDGARPAGEPGDVERPKTPTGGATNFPASATVREPVEGGRWPANILLSHLPECEGNGPSHTDVLCAPGCPVAEMNEMSGDSASPAGSLRYSQPSTPATPGAANPESVVKRHEVVAEGYGDAGGAARFFYIAKPRTRERIGGTIRNLHPTVKPIELMRHLVRLVTPPIVLECPTCSVAFEVNGTREEEGGVRPVRGMRGDVRGGGEVGQADAAVLRSDVQQPSDSGEAADRVDEDEQRLHPAAFAEASEREGRRLRDGASRGDGEGTREDLDGGRGGAPSERGEGRQQAGESRGAAEEGARSEEEATEEADHLSSLRGSDRDVRTCKTCGTALVSRPGVVLDPFLGSGSTGCAAMVEGFRFIGIEQDLESCETALARVSDYAFVNGRDRPTST